MRDLRRPGMLMYPLRSWLGITPKPRLCYSLPQRLTTKGYSDNAQPEPREAWVLNLRSRVPETR